jgi:hypothetical protein
MATHEEVLGLMQVAVAAYPAHKMKGFMPETYAIYARLLQDIDIEILQAAVMEQIASNDWFPTVAELRRAAFDIISAQNSYMTAAEAWALVKQEVRRVGWYGKPNLPDICIKSLGGDWRAFCENEDPEGVIRGQFERAYNAMLQRATQNMRMLPEVRELSERLALEAGHQASSGIVSIAGVLASMTGEHDA